MAADANKLIEEWRVLDAEAQTISSYLQEITDFVLPSKSNVSRDDSQPLERRGTRRYDDTAVHANELLAAGLASSLTSPSMKWFTPKMREDVLNDDDEVSEWLQQCAERMYGTLAASNFYTEIDEAYLDLGGYGTTALFMRDLPANVRGSFRGIDFRTWPIRQYRHGEGADGIVNSVFRMFELKAHQAQARFAPLPRFRGLGEKVEKALTSGKPQENHKQFKFLHALSPRAERSLNSQSPLDMPFESVYVAVDDKHVISEGGFFEFPLAVPRWRKNADDGNWGRSPAMTVLAGVRTLNEAGRLETKAWGKDIDPPLLVEDNGVIGQLRTYPGGITYKRRGAEVGHLESASKYSVSQYKKEEARVMIRQAFFVDQLEHIVAEPTTNMTAFEYGRRVELMQRMLGPTYGRLQHELLDPIVDRVFNTMLRGGAFPPVPELLVRAANAGLDMQLDVEYVGPLALAQRAQEIDALDRVYIFGGNISKVTGDQTHLDRINHDKAVQRAAKLMGVPADLVRSDEEVERMQEARREALEAQNTLDQASQMGGVIKDTQGVTTP